MPKMIYAKDGITVGKKKKFQGCFFHQYILYFRRYDTHLFDIFELLDFPTSH
jgi:hypothetical protein